MVCVLYLQGHELRIEVKENKELLVTVRLGSLCASVFSSCVKFTRGDGSCALQAKQGQAEVFGTELSLGETLVLRGQKLAVRTLGCAKLCCSRQQSLPANDYCALLLDGRGLALHRLTGSFKARRSSPGMALCSSSPLTLRAWKRSQMLCTPPSLVPVFPLIR